jgi:hypothetical protein
LQIEDVAGNAEQAEKNVSSAVGKVLGMHDQGQSAESPIPSNTLLGRLQNINGRISRALNIINDEAARL